MKILVRNIIVITSLFCAFAGCKQDIGNAIWDVDIIAPVIHTKLDMADLLADSLLVADSEGVLRLSVERPLIDLPVDSILKIPDTTISNGISSPLALVDIPPGFVIPGGVTEQTEYELGDVALKTLKLRKGFLKLRVKSIVETGIDFEYRIPNASKFGTPFVTTGTIAAGSVTDTSFADYEFDLKDYEFDLTGAGGTSFNTLITSFFVSTSLDGDTVDIPGGGEENPFLIIDYTFSDLVPSYGAGYFGQQSSNVENENSELDVLNRITEGQMFLDSVTIGLNVTNPVGADARFNLGQLSSINTRTNNTIDLAHEIIGSTILLTRAQDISGTAESVIPSVVSYELNNGNSNIVEFIENLPDQLGFTFGFELNPLGNVSAGNDFFYYDRPFQALMDIDVPLRATLTNLTLVDTVDWNLGETGVVESVNSGTFTLKAVNGFPLEGQVEIILLDENLNQLDTLVAPSVIAAPPLNSENRVVNPLESIIQIPVPEDVSNVLPATKKVHIKVRFNTAAQPDLIEFYDTYMIDLKLIGDFNINFGTSVF